MTKKAIRKLKLVFFPCQENNFKSYLLRRDFLFHLVFLFFVLRVIILPFYIHFPKSIFFAQIVSSDILSLLNTERRSQGLILLREDPNLKQAAYLKAQDMLNKDYFGHQSPAGVSAWYWIQKSGYDYEVAGENLAIGFLDSEEVHQAWNNSSLHKSNLLDPRFEDVGIAVLTGEFQGNETTVVVQLFGKPIETPSVKEKILPPVEAKTEEIPETKPEEAKETKPEEIVPIVSVALEKEASSFQSDFWEFLIKKYSDILQKTIFLFVFLIIFVLILNLVVAMGLAYPLGARLAVLQELLPATLLALIFLVFLGLLDKSIIVQFIPHHLEI